MTYFALRQDGREAQTSDYHIMMEKLLIFDFDGVLVDSELIKNRIEAQALSSHGYLISLEECIKKFIGQTPKNICEAIFAETAIEIACSYTEALQPIILQHFEMGLKSLITPLLELIDAMKINRCIVSHSPKNRLLKALEITDQMQFFDQNSIFTTQDTSQEDMFLFAAKQMRFAPENCIVIEDSFLGIEAALSIGMPVIGFLGASHSNFNWYHEKMYSYDVPIARSCHELLQILKGMLMSKIVRFNERCTNEVLQKIQ